MDSIRVLDITNSIAGAYCTRVLSEHGAEVILVEGPEGNPLRRSPPFAEHDASNEVSLEFSHYHLNKKSAILDLSHDKSRNVFDSLASTCDVIVSDHHPNHKHRDDLLDYQRLQSVKGDIILTNITPFGLTGPKSNYAATDLTIQALAGFPQINGHPDYPPLVFPNEQASQLSGLNAAVGTMAAIYFEKFNKGVGQMIDISQQEVLLIHLEHHLQLETFDSYQPNPMFPNMNIGQRGGRFFCPPGAEGPALPAGLFPCKDGWVCVAAAQPKELKNLAELLGGELMELKENGELDTVFSIGSLGKIREIIQLITEKTKEYKASELEQAGQNSEIAISKLQNPKDILNDAHFNENNFIREIEHPHLDMIQDTGSGARTKSSLRQKFSPPPKHGEHSEEIYSNIDIGQETLNDLRARDVIGGYIDE